jgi:hypothetical protein
MHDLDAHQRAPGVVILTATRLEIAVGCRKAGGMRARVIGMSGNIT